MRRLCRSANGYKLRGCNEFAHPGRCLFTTRPRRANAVRYCHLRFLSVLGARPQFIKAGPLSAVLRRDHQEVVVHTGQHYDYGMSDGFFEELGLPQPDHHLGVGSAPHGCQTGAMLSGLERLMLEERPDVVIVYGDTNSTLAGALAASKLQIPVAHVEAGLRSFNRRMPEEVNRVVTDHVSTYLFVPAPSSRAQLEREGIRAGVHVVGDIMLDAVLMHRKRAAERSRYPESLGLNAGGYYLATVHRAENTDDEARLRDIVAGLNALDLPVVLPLHPRTCKQLAAFGLVTGDNVTPLAPVGYLDMVQLQSRSACVLTDSGGMQKEAYYLEVPCVTLRDETEWVETIETGWNVLAGTDATAIRDAVRRVRANRRPHPDLYGTGDTAVRIAAAFGS
jgi:UDP-GlcNAc3NAcA epimerase